MATSKLSSREENILEQCRLSPVFWWDSSSKWGFFGGHMELVCIKRRNMCSTPRIDLPCSAHKHVGYHDDIHSTQTLNKYRDTDWADSEESKDDKPGLLEYSKFNSKWAANKIPNTEAKSSNLAHATNKKILLMSQAVIFCYFASIFLSYDFINENWKVQGKE